MERRCESVELQEPKPGERRAEDDEARAGKHWNYSFGFAFAQADFRELIFSHDGREQCRGHQDGRAQEP